MSPFEGSFVERVRNSWITLHSTSSEIQCNGYEVVAWPAEAENLRSTGVLWGAGPQSQLCLEHIVSLLAPRVTVALLSAQRASCN